MRTWTAVALVFLNGCAVVSQLPTLKYCDSVSYVRAGREITVKAHCFEAVESVLPVPVDAFPFP